jgi:protein phosphatase
LGDRLLLCSDGLTKHVSDKDIGRALESEQSAESACRRLVDAANAAGGTDNITVVVAVFHDASQISMASQTATKAAIEEPSKAASLQEAIATKPQRAETSLAQII